MTIIRNVDDMLSVDEQKELDRLEAIIRKGKDAFIAVGEALLEIRDKRLYREEYEAFGPYCIEVWGFTARHANRLIEASGVVAEMITGPTGLLPTSERQARALASVPPEKRQDALRKASEATGGKPTARAIREATGAPDDAFLRTMRRLTEQLQAVELEDDALRKRFLSEAQLLMKTLTDIIGMLA